MRLQAVWDPFLVLQSVAMAFMGSYSAVTLTELLRVSRRVQTKFFGERSVLFYNAVAVGGAAIWSMHFIGMGALRLRHPESGEFIPVYFNLWVTLFSLAVPILFVWLAMYISTRDTIFILTKEEICMFLAKETHNFKLLRSPIVLLRLFLLKNLNPLLVSGVITGAGVLIMHYVGMLGMQCQAIIRWDYAIIGFTVVIAVVVSFVAYWILFRLLSLYPSEEKLRVASALVMTVAVCVVHYLGMAAATYHYAPDRHMVEEGSGVRVSRNILLVISLNCGVMFNYFVSMACQGELRSCYYRLLPFELLLGKINKEKAFAGTKYMANYTGMRANYMKDVVDVLRDRQLCCSNNSLGKIYDLQREDSENASSSTARRPSFLSMSSSHLRDLMDSGSHPSQASEHELPV